MANGVADLINLGQDDLINKVVSLQQDITELKTQRETDAQRIYELTRQLETSNAAQQYLIQELELVSENGFDSKQDEEIEKTRVELEEFRKKYLALKSDFELLQVDHEFALQENNALKEELKLTSKKFEEVPLNNKENEDLKVRINSLEEEYILLLKKMDVLECRDIENTFSLGAKEREIEILKDQIECLQENLKTRKEELEEKGRILETTQDQLSDANAKIALLSVSSDANNSKGNSLFAEVDDQRQAMKQLLNAQNKSYLEMKKKYLESDHEIRRLKRENMAIHTELNTCAKIFSKARQDFHDSLMAQIKILQKQNERLENQLKWYEENLKQNAGQNILWLDSMLNFCKQETDELKIEVRKVRMSKAFLEEEVRNLQQDSARCRFDALRLRLNISEYENILNENNIKFKTPNINDLTKKLSTMTEGQKFNLLEKPLETFLKKEADKMNAVTIIDVTPVKNNQREGTTEEKENQKVKLMVPHKDKVAVREKKINDQMLILEKSHLNENISNTKAEPNKDEIVVQEQKSNDEMHILEKNYLPVPNEDEVADQENKSNEMSILENRESTGKVLKPKAILLQPILKNSNYIFTNNPKKVQFAYSTEPKKDGERNESANEINNENETNNQPNCGQRGSVIIRRFKVKSAQEQYSNN